MNYLFPDNANCIISKNNIIGGLWIGNYKAALDSDFLYDNDINCIINCTPDIPFIYDICSLKCKLTTYRIPVHDNRTMHDIFLMEKYLYKVIPFIITNLKKKKNVFIGCFAGKQRSGIVMLSTLYTLIINDILPTEYCQNLPKNIDDKNELVKNIIYYLQEKRPCIFTYGLRINFKKSFENYHNCIF